MRGLSFNCASAAAAGSGRARHRHAHRPGARVAGAAGGVAGIRRLLRLAAAVALSILVAGAAATSIGLLLPWALARTGADPALGSGPVATIIQDALSLLVYFALVSYLVPLAATRLGPSRPNALLTCVTLAAGKRLKFQKSQRKLSSSCHASMATIAGNRSSKRPVHVEQTMAHYIHHVPWRLWLLHPTTQARRTQRGGGRGVGEDHRRGHRGAGQQRDRQPHSGLSARCRERGMPF